MSMGGIDFFFLFLDYVNSVLDKCDMYPKLNKWTDIMIFIKIFESISWFYLYLICI